MEEEWDVINSIHSSQSVQQNKRFRPSVELDFNRFESMPQFHLEEDSLSSLSFGKEEPLEDQLNVYEDVDDEGAFGSTDAELPEDEPDLKKGWSNGEEPVAELDLKNGWSKGEEPAAELDLKNGWSNGDEEPAAELDLKEGPNPNGDEAPKPNGDELEPSGEEDDVSHEEERLEVEFEAEVDSSVDEPLEDEPEELEDSQEENLREVELEEDDDDSRVSLLKEEKVLYCEPLSLLDSELVIDLDIKEQEQEETIALLNRKLTDNDTNETTAIDNDSFLSSIINHDKEYLNQETEEQTTRESLLDKNTTWRNVNSISGSSVPYMSDLPIPKQQAKQQHSTFNPTTFLHPFLSAQLSFSPTKNAVDQPHISKEQPQPIINKTSSVLLSTHQLPSFAAAPHEHPVWTTSRFDSHDIPPHEEVSEEQDKVEDDAVILENISNCFTSSNDQLDTIIYKLKSIRPIQEWCQLRKLDLSRQQLTSIKNLNTSFPCLEYLQLSHNQLETLTDLPTTLTYLYASNNNLAEIDIYQLHKLQVLNIANNHIHHLEDMAELKSLRVIDASHNSITSCKPFQNLPVLSKLFLKSNCIRRLVNFTSMIQDNQLEILDVSHNRIESLDSIENLTRLCYLNAEHNNIKYIQIDQPVEKLYKLQLSFNGLKSADISQFPGIRTLYLDDNVIHRIIGMNCISRIESFSLRDQGGSKIDYNLQYLRGSRKLYLSGSPFYNINRLVDFFSLEYLELCAAHIEQLPDDFGKQVPNLSTLYLSFNRLSNIQPLRNLKYLRRLVLIDNRLIHINEVLDVVKNMRRLKYLDLRQNPMTANIYPPINTKPLESNDKVSPYVVTALDTSWPVQDNEFCSTLEPQWISRRSTYRTAFINTCTKLVELDHVKINQDERLPR